MRGLEENRDGKIPAAVFFLASDDSGVPTYDVLCEVHGVCETAMPISQAPPRTCPTCEGPATVYFSPANLPGERIDAMAEVNANNPDPKSRGINRGLPLVKESLGFDREGKEHFRYRPMTSAEVGSNRNAREICKRHNLEPKDGGAWRSRK